MHEINISQANCTKLSLDSVVNLACENGELTGFNITAYTGSIIERRWGKLAIEVSGISAKPNFPIFRDHDHTKIVGFSTSSRRDGSFEVSGKFSKHTQTAQEVMALAKEGFPWQASIGVSPKKVLSLEKGELHIVNGQSITGPAEIWMESEVYETSFVPLGADDKTSVAVFSEGSADDRGMSMENTNQQKLASDWKNSESLRAEFAGSFETYLAYFREDPGVSVRVLGSQTGPVQKHRFSFADGEGR